MSQSEIPVTDAAPAPSPEAVAETAAPEAAAEKRGKPRWLVMLVVGLVALGVIYGLTFPVLSYLKNAPQDPELSAPVDLSKLKPGMRPHLGMGTPSLPAPPHH